MMHIFVMALIAILIIVCFSTIGWVVGTQKNAVRLGNRVLAKRRALEYHQRSAVGLLNSINYAISTHIDYEKGYNKDYFAVLANAFRSEMPGEKMVNVISGFGIPRSKVADLVGEQIRTMKELHFSFNNDLREYLNEEAEYLSVVESSAAGLFSKEFWSGKTVTLDQCDLSLLPETQIQQLQKSRVN